MDVKNEYVPGVCNIGPEEIKKRKKRVILAGIAAFILTWFTFQQPGLLWLRLCLFVSVAALVVLYMQVKLRFCVSFGAFGYFNFDKLGTLQKVTNKEFIFKDRMKAAGMILFGCIIGMLYTYLSLYVATH
jgi:hypothetical protein